MQAIHSHYEHQHFWYYNHRFLTVVEIKAEEIFEFSEQEIIAIRPRYFSVSSVHTFVATYQKLYHTHSVRLKSLF